MADGLNKVILIGHLGADPELRVTNSGKEVVDFRLATTESWRGDDGNRNQSTEWHKIIFWGKQARIIKDNLTKGSQVYVEGKIKTRKWTDNDGRDRYSTEIVGNRVLFLGSKRPLGGAYDAPQSGQNPAGGAKPSYTPSDDDIPF